MNAASYKFDNGQSYPTKRFPARALGLLRRRKDGGGHWLVAYRKAEEQRYSNVHRRIKETHKKQKNIRAADTLHGNTLDGPLLLRLHCVDKPSELCSVDISEQELNSVKPEDLKVFDNVAYIDASINSLSLGSFSSFVSLRELNLSVNGICNMTFDAPDFPYLEVLDLSYNSLSADDIVSIGWLPRLKVLHLTGNQLHHLPPHLGFSNCESTQLPAKEEDTQFRALEVLMLDDNKLSSGVFSSLTNLKRLKYLNLQGNRISEIPYLQPAGFSKPVRTTEKQAEEDGPAYTEPDPDSGEDLKRISQEHHKEHCKVSSLPLSELQFLNLSDNKIAEEEALMAVALFPMLREIDIHSNPLTTQRSGDPPLLTYYLQERLGITIKRKKTQEVVKPPLKVSMDPKWKVQERIPKVSKKPLLMDAPCPVQTYEDEETEVTVKNTPESERKSSRDNIQENTEHFFVTQVADISDYEFDRRGDENEPENKARNEDDKFNCYKMLMDAKPDPDVVEPIGIQTAVRMLEHTLKNLNVYRDSKPKLDSIQMPYREREKRIKELPALKPIKQPSERVDEMIKELRESTTTREVALSSALHGAGVNEQEYKEALSLLRDMKMKYKMVHKKTMEQAASLESDGNTNLNGVQPPPVQML
ncbi:X-ray radiation resistance-associated protein 1 [Toxotes jaculatrix]|uniref:X-ray radiation resistance-associated protein 1 n=1 Tax=Toxotes jaculatrix TaxID=941984 RepID=UPI001B3A7E19|nr:X-ray radiation resistance-associated protein 1 [Toxotes jaculatrix]